ncbi:MAG: hypothetical protein ACR2NT_08325 [Acidimicrobiia bacterium]
MTTDLLEVAGHTSFKPYPIGTADRRTVLYAGGSCGIPPTWRSPITPWTEGNLPAKIDHIQVSGVAGPAPALPRPRCQTCPPSAA